MTAGEGQANPDIVAGTMIVFVNSSFALYVDQKLASLKHKLVVMTHLGEQIIHTFIFKGCEILIKDVVLKANLIPLEMWDFDVILGMD